MIGQAVGLILIGACGLLVLSLLVGLAVARFIFVGKGPDVGPGSDVPPLPGGDAEVRDIRDARIRREMDG